MSSIIRVDTLQKPDGSTPTAADLGLDVSGSVVQVVSVTKVGDFVTVSETFSDVITQSITPKAVNSKFIIEYTGPFYKNNSSEGQTGSNYWQITDETDSPVNATNWSQNSTSHYGIYGNGFTFLIAPASFKALHQHSGNATKTFKFKVRAAVSGNNTYIYGGGTFTIYEIAQ